MNTRVFSACLLVVVLLIATSLEVRAASPRCQDSCIRTGNGKCGVRGNSIYRDGRPSVTGTHCGRDSRSKSGGGEDGDHVSQLLHLFPMFKIKQSLLQHQEEEQEDTTSTFSRHLLRYLQVDLGKITDEDDFGSGGGGSNPHDGALLLLPLSSLCPSCSHLAHQFSALHGQLELIKMEVESCVRKMAQVMMMAAAAAVVAQENVGVVVEEHHQYPGKLTQLRRRILEKCSSCAEGSLPKLKLHRVEVVDQHPSQLMIINKNNATSPEDEPEDPSNNGTPFHEEEVVEKAEGNGNEAHHKLGSSAKLKKHKRCEHCGALFVKRFLHRHLMNAHKDTFFSQLKSEGLSPTQFCALVGRLFEKVVRAPRPNRLYKCEFCDFLRFNKCDVQSHMVQEHHSLLASHLQELQQAALLAKGEAHLFFEPPPAPPQPIKKFPSKCEYCRESRNTVIFSSSYQFFRHRAAIHLDSFFADQRSPRFGIDQFKQLVVSMFKNLKTMEHDSHGSHICPFCDGHGAVRCVKRRDIVLHMLRKHQGQLDSKLCQLQTTTLEELRRTGGSASVHHQHQQHKSKRKVAKRNNRRKIETLSSKLRKYTKCDHCGLLFIKRFLHRHLMNAHMDTFFSRLKSGGLSLAKFGALVGKLCEEKVVRTPNRFHKCGFCEFRRFNKCDVRSHMVQKHSTQLESILQELQQAELANDSGAPLFKAPPHSHDGEGFGTEGAVKLEIGDEKMEIGKTEIVTAEFETWSSSVEPTIPLSHDEPDEEGQLSHLPNHGSGDMDDYSEEAKPDASETHLILGI